MSQAKHTPGPWTQAANFPDGMTAICDYNEGKGPYRLIADCGKNDRPQSENDANARLIAAAPELLFALKYALPFIPTLAITTEAYENGGKHVADVVRVAIAKATAK